MGNGNNGNIKVKEVSPFVDEASWIAEKTGDLIDTMISIDDIDMKKIDTLTAGILSGRYDTGFNVQETGTLKDALAGGRLSAKVLRLIARKCSIVNTCIDALVREISTMKWYIEEVKGTSPPQFHKTRLTKFYQRPVFAWRDQGRHFIRFMGMILRDLFVLDYILVEKVRNTSKRIIGFHPLDPGLYSIVEKTGGIGFFKLDDFYTGGDKKIPKLYPKNAIYLIMYPRTSSYYGISPLEGILEEMGALVFSTIALRKEFTHGEIPPGILNLGPMGETQQRRIKNELITTRGMQWLIKILFGIASAQWIELKRSNAEHQKSELIYIIKYYLYFLILICIFDL